MIQDTPRAYDRNENFASWAGAKLIGNDGQIVALRGDVPRYDEVQNEVRAIRAALGAGINRVYCDIEHLPTCESIRSQLTPEELARVTFSRMSIGLGAAQ